MNIIPVYVYVDRGMDRLADIRQINMDRVRESHRQTKRSRQSERKKSLYLLCEYQYIV